MRLVWVDYRRPTGAENADIYYYDIPNGIEGILTTRIGYKAYPVIDGDTIVWSEQASSGQNLYMFNLVSKQETKLLSGANIIGFDVWGDNIAWSSFNCNTNPCTYNIYIYNTITKKTQKILDAKSPLDYDLRIYGNKTVYIVGSGTNTQVNVYDLNTKLTTQITNGAGLKMNAAVYNNTVVWADKRNGNWDIYSYDLVQKTEKALVTESHNQMYPDIYGNKIVYLDARNYSNIYMYVKLD
jgi:beta propeller repeat protein